MFPSDTQLDQPPWNAVDPPLMDLLAERDSGLP